MEETILEMVERLINELAYAGHPQIEYIPGNQFKMAEDAIKFMHLRVYQARDIAEMIEKKLNAQQSIEAEHDKAVPA